ncbi:MAG: IS3 family transposase, partial [Vulcanimicrobiaceae bacterium]
RAALYKAASAQEKPKLPTPRGPRPTSISDERLLTEIRTIATEHAAWGHRKVWAMLRRRTILVARRRVWKLMHEAKLTFAPNARRCEPRRGTVKVNHTFSPVGRPTGNAVAERVIQTMETARSS